MARIRSIKPEFWKDGRIARISEGCALFFIALWNFCDDEGKCRTDSRELSNCIPIFRASDIGKHLRRLTEEGLLRLSSDTQWVQVENWQHQKIDKPKQPKIRSEDIEWLPILRKDYSSTALRGIAEQSGNARRKDRIGEDRIGEDRIGVTATPEFAESEFSFSPPLDAESYSKKLLPDDLSRKPKNKVTPITAATWNAYASAFEKRYKTNPLRNATVNSQLANFVRRVGEENAPALIEFYVWHPGSLYTLNNHPVGLALRDAEKLYAEWRTKRFTSFKQAQDIENSAAAQVLIEKIRKDGI